jgi:hypothetical protein
MSIVKNFDSMLRQEQYYQLAEDFGTGVGIAEWEEPLYGYHTNLRKIPDDIKVLILTNHMIEKGIYQQTIKEVLRLKSKYGKRNIKESTIYEKAINNITQFEVD